MIANPQSQEDCVPGDRAVGRAGRPGSTEVKMLCPGKIIIIILKPIWLF